MSFHTVTESAIGNETITVDHGLTAGQVIVAMGADLLHEGEKIRIAPDQGEAP